jgi:acyl dehydratase
MRPPTVDVGDPIGPERRRSPDAAAVRAYAVRLDAPEKLFVDREFMQQQGFRDVIVPGPMQTAFLEQMLRRHFPAWQLERLSATFRISVVTGEPIVLSGVVTEVHQTRTGRRVVCDLVIENAEGDRATTGSAVLREVSVPG